MICVHMSIEQYVLSVPPEASESEVVVDAAIHVFRRIDAIEETHDSEESPDDQEFHVHKVQCPKSSEAHLIRCKVLTLPQSVFTETKVIEEVQPYL
jgi:hypothetical protein